MIHFLLRLETVYMRNSNRCEISPRDLNIGKIAYFLLRSHEVSPRSATSFVHRTTQECSRFFIVFMFGANLFVCLFVDLF